MRELLNDLYSKQYGLGDDLLLDEDNNKIISETLLRALLPPELRLAATTSEAVTTLEAVTTTEAGVCMVGHGKSIVDAFFGVALEYNPNREDSEVEENEEESEEEQ